MERLHFTQEQVSKILDSIVQEEGGIQSVLKLSFEAIMRAEREIHNEINKDVSNGYRPPSGASVAVNYSASLRLMLFFLQFAAVIITFDS